MSLGGGGHKDEVGGGVADFTGGTGNAERQAGGYVGVQEEMTNASSIG